ncbi:Hypothetical predicted protein [Olea europaea subsp. europaea]|uniref:S phase cyclin A-associated protein in the endoplasmic reticulum N-terminal domain-containing protein n=1 Tax=Olea europaea subsp. europaea TaxID=158383 RepID=A0A8S0RE79_OLEEU|nr:Hypothetical predicted protein [Olea europaea subsp. europaea]
MESSGGDDQGSGWMQVKKKHRSKSKFPQHGLVGGLSGKQNSTHMSTQLPSGVKQDKDKFASDAGRDCTIHGPNSAPNSSSVSTEDEGVVHCLDKCVVSQDNGNSKSFHLAATEIQDSNCKVVANEEHTQKNTVFPKIKWGDLDDGTLIMHYGNARETGIKLGGIDNHNLVCMKSESADESISCSKIDSKDNKFVGAIVDENQALPKSDSFSPMAVSFAKDRNGVNEVSSEDVKVQITSERIVSQSTITSNFDVDCEHVNSKTDDASHLFGENTPCAAIEEIGMMETPGLKSETGCSKDYVVPPEKSEHRSVAESIPTTSVEESRYQKCDSISEDLLETQNLNSIDSDDTCESKERFRQRLWCFLFESLNRAVDELYLLCELECDNEQMKEAVLVLEEAASDFRELNSRVEEFEKLKRSSSHVTAGVPLVMQSDHRRPHALSWEVRRMTSSPRRAEILSSSLEAFRKIQQERTREHANSAEKLGSDFHSRHPRSGDILEKSAKSSNLEGDKYAKRSNLEGDPKESTAKERKRTGSTNNSRRSIKEKKNIDSGKSNSVASRLPINRELNADSEADRPLSKKEKMLAEHTVGKNSKAIDSLKRQIPCLEKEGEKRNGNSWKSMDAWKEKRNWEDILGTPHRVSSRFSYSPGMGRKSADRARLLHDKLMSPEKKKKSALDLKKEAEEKHARATRIRTQLENERMQKLQRTSDKLNRVNEWQTVRSNKLRESMFARHQRSESRHEAYLAQVVRRAGDESSKVNEVRFITSLNEENKKLILRQKLQDSELRRAEKLQVMKIKQREDMAREEAVLERKRLIEAEKLQRLAETQRRKEEAQVRREEERKASSAAREARAMEQMRRKEVRAKAQQEEAELLAQRLAERLSESEQRRKFYLEQIRERASMDFRDQSSPLLRRSVNKDGQSQGRSTPNGNGEDYQVNNSGCTGGSSIATGNESMHNSLKRKIKKIRQRLMSLKHEFSEPSVGVENSGIGYRTAVGTARGKIARWLQELQKLRQARKDGASTFGLITAEIIKFLEGRDTELQASRQAGLIDFIASALPASHTSKPEACQVTTYLLRLLRVVLVVPANRSYFLAQNLLPPIIPMLAAALENYIKMAASSNIRGSTNFISSKTSVGNLETISEILDGFLWSVAAIIGHVSCDVRQHQMQDGLLELVIEYQIIHRLRDFFALYDRPQVEGSPFPSSILLSINLLTVLTSKFGEVSSIDWESFPNATMPGKTPGEAKHFEAATSRSSTSCDSIGYNSSPFLPTGSTPVNLPDVPEDRPLDNIPVLIDNKSHKIECISYKIKTVEVVDESPIIPTDNKPEGSLPQKVGKNSSSCAAEQKNANDFGLKRPVAFLLSAMSETGLVCLPSMLTAVLLQANNRLSAEQSSYVLPSNFEEVATGVLKVLNNLALIDITFIQKTLARPDLKMEFFHLMSFLLSYCTSKWEIATDKIGQLLLECLVLLGYFALFHPENQAVLRWGKSPTILHKVCDLPFVFFSDPELMPILAGTLVATSFGCEQNKDVIQQELSVDMLLSLLKSCKNSQCNSTLNSTPAEESALEFKKLPVDASQKSYRNNLRSSRGVPQRGFLPASNMRTMKARNLKDTKAAKLCEEVCLGTGQSSSETSALMLRFPISFINKAEQFFAAETTGLSEGDY